MALQQAPVDALAGLAEGDDCDAVLLPTGLLTDLTSPVILLSGGCLACHGQGRCVVVATRGDDPRTVRTVAADDPCRTASLLARLVWITEFEKALKIVTPDQPHDAVLLVGSEPKLPSRFIRPIHVGRLWFELTGLPMVMFCWVAAPPGPPEGLEDLLAEATADIMADQQGKCAGSGCMEPLTAEHVEGLTEYLQRCRDVTLIEPLPRLVLPANRKY